MAPQLPFRQFFSSSTNDDLSKPAHGEPSLLSKPFASIVEMVGKSNKFDFTNRTSGGVKLGSSIGEAFTREVGKALKDSERQAAKQAKRAAAAADSTKDIGIRIVDFKAPSKDLGDEGVTALVPGLYHAVKSCPLICLEDINLQGNALSVKCLGYLGLVIHSARHDLKTVNLSNNKISVITPSDAVNWRMFLIAFHDCLRLRRLDLSGNQLGVRAFEILARVYEDEPAITPLRLGGDNSVISLEEDAEEHDEDQNHTSDIVAEGRRASTDERNMADAHFLKRRCGLRSLPYLDLSETGLDDAGALWLSFVIAQHYLPAQLIDGVNGATATSSVGIYQQTHGSTGIDWEANTDTLGIHGLELLRKVEAIRREVIHDGASIASSGDTSNDVDGYGTVQHSRASLMIRTEHTSRDSTGRFAHAITGGEAAIASVDSMRHRLQRQIIQQHGTRGSELWDAAILVICLSRRLYILARPLASVIAAATTPNSTRCDHGRPKRPIASSEEVVAPKQSSNTAITTAGGGMTSLTDVTNKSKLALFDPARNKQVEFTGGSDLSKKLKSVVLNGPTKAQYMQYQLKHHREVSYESHNLPWILPLRVVERIMLHIMLPVELTSLTEQQLRAAYEFGQTRTSLAMEKEWGRKNDSAQVLMVLNHIGCLEYEAHPFRGPPPG